VADKLAALSRKGEGGDRRGGGGNKWSVFVTGATGFVGATLLADILQHRSQYSSLKVHCLVRGSSREEGLARVVAAVKV
jgi:nucleoside-diphosphate-sugar epimerase